MIQKIQRFKVNPPYSSEIENKEQRLSVRRYIYKISLVGQMAFLLGFFLTLGLLIG